MISVDAVGRLGNTMFQLAFAHAAARRLETTFVLGPAPLWEHFELGAWGRRSVRLRRKLEARLRSFDRVVVDNAEEPGEVLSRLRDGAAYNGFFQSADYFAGYEEEVRALFAVRETQRRAFGERYGDLGRYACIHVRRGDYLDNGWALPDGYFRTALEALGDLEGRPVLVVSDDTPRAAAELADVPGLRFEANDQITDLQLLAQADRLVLSNSSFSWWGAWLNDRDDLRVVAPRHWVGFREGSELPRRVIPAEWDQVGVS